MTLTRKRLSIVIAAAIALVIVLPLAATASGPAYSGAAPRQTVVPSFGTGTATATVLPLDPNTGEIGVDARTTETLPVGFAGSQIGRDFAEAEGLLYQWIDVAAPGKYDVSVTMNVTNLTGETHWEGLPGFSRSDIEVLALGVFTAGSSEAKAASLNPVTCPGGQCTLTLTGIVDVFDASSTQDIQAIGGLRATAISQGAGFATALAAATITDITANPAGNVQPPPPPVPGAVRVLLESVNVDSRSAGVTSLTTLAAGSNYLIEPRGMYGYDISGDFADAECSTLGADAIFRDERFPADALDVLLNGSPVAWTPEPGSVSTDDSRCATNHTYQKVIAGTGAPVTLRVNDDGLNDNLGAIPVNIYLLP